MPRDDDEPGAAGAEQSLDAVPSGDGPSLQLDAWDGRPVLAHGFEDLTAAEWRLLEALAARADVHVSLPYEPGRAVYASLSRTAGDLATLARDSVVELPPRAPEFLPASLAHLERQLFSDAPVRARLDGSLRFLEGAGVRGERQILGVHHLCAVRGQIPAGRAADTSVCQPTMCRTKKLSTMRRQEGILVKFTRSSRNH